MELYNSPIIVNEHSINSVKKDTFTDDDVRMVESKFKDKVEIILKRNEDEIITREYVGYIVLPNNVLIIKPKVHGAGFLNMLRYALELPELGEEYPELTKGENYYDILVRFFLLELEKILQRGLYTGYKIYDDNLSCIRGKILFKDGWNWADKFHIVFFNHILQYCLVVIQS